MLIWIYDMMFELLSSDGIYFGKITFMILCSYLVNIHTMCLQAGNVVPSGGRYMCLRAGDVVPSGDYDITTKHTIYDICFTKVLWHSRVFGKPTTYFAICVF